VKVLIDDREEDGRPVELGRGAMGITRRSTSIFDALWH
jgi:hypothetical protein